MQWNFGIKPRFTESTCISYRIFRYYYRIGTHVLRKSTTFVAEKGKAPTYIIDITNNSSINFIHKQTTRQ